jgi:DNA-binding HxlR family transcriptional regulator
MASINRRSLDDELLSLDQTLGELINMGLVEATFHAEEEGAPTRYSLIDLTAEARAIAEESWQPEMAAHI